MNIFAISSVLIVLFTSSLAALLLFKSYSVLANRYWGFLCVCATIYGIGAFKFSTVLSKDIAYFWWQFAYIGVIFAPVMYVHFVDSYLKLNQRLLLRITYVFGFVFLILNFFFRDSFIGELKFSFNEFYTIDWLARKNISWLIFYILFYWGLLLYSFSLLLLRYLRVPDSKKNQLKYLILGSLIGWLGPHGVYLSYFGVKLYPFSNFLLAIYPLIIGYAIIRYRLLDITLILTRSTIFIAVYSLVLGIPFALAFGLRASLINVLSDNWWMIPLITSTVLATVGPFIYLYIQGRAEDKLLQEQRRYQSTLRQASAGMGKIKDLKRLVTLIVHIMTKTVRVEFSMVFLNDVHSKKFRLGAYRSSAARMKFRSDLVYESAVVQFLQETQNPIVYDEIKQRTQDYGDLKLARLETELKAMDAALVVPSFIDEKLVAILVMGAKLSGKTYSSDDLSVFSILANQSALAIENAQFYDEMKNTHIQLLKAEKMATIGTLADGLSHQINNRLHAMGFIAGDALDTLKLGHNLPMSLEVKEMVLDLEHALNRIESNVQQGGEIVQGLLKYTRKDDA
jgi:two-component system NtrC family sensor kinase